jgi:hypothetical protein
VCDTAAHHDECFITSYLYMRGTLRYVRECCYPHLLTRGLPYRLPGSRMVNFNSPVVAEHDFSAHAFASVSRLCGA